jgi:transposase InsO family protein
MQYKPGRVNQVADALSRMATKGTDQSVLDHEIPCLSIEVSPVVRKSIAIPEAGPTVAEVSLEPLRVSEIVAAQADDEMCKTLLSKNCFAVDDRGLVCRTSPLDGALQIVMPTEFQERCLSLCHLPKIAGHPGSTKMYTQMRKLFYWPRMAIDINRYVSSCPSCVKKSLRVSRKTMKLQLFPPSSPMEFIAMHILGPLTQTDKGNRFLLVVTDRFSKLTRAYPLASTTADVVAKTLFDGWVAAGYGIPQVLLTDNGTQFVSKFFQSFCRILGVKQVFTSAYRPSTNGQTERFNRTIVEFMGAYVSEHQREWDELAGIATYSYNVKPHPSTGFTPFELVTAVPQVSLLAQVVLTPHRRERSKAEIRNEFLATVSRCTTLARENLSMQQGRYKRAHDAHVRARTIDLAVGDWAYVKTYVAQRELSKKLIFPAVGPYAVTKVGIDRRTYNVNTPDGEVTVSADRVRKCPFPEDLPEGMQFASNVNEEKASESREEDDLSDLEEYVIDHLVSHRRDEKGAMNIRVRWFGHDSSSDTWEPLLHIPPEMLRRYVKRKNLAPKDFARS